MKLIFTENIEDGLNKLKELNFETKKEFNQLIRKILEDDYGEDYFLDNRGVNFDKMNVEELFSYLSEFLDSSYVDSDYSQYKLFDRKTLEEIKASDIVFEIEGMNHLVDITISTRNPNKWFIIDSETEQLYKVDKNNSFVSLETAEINKIKRICMEITES